MFIERASGYIQLFIKKYLPFVLKNNEDYKKGNYINALTNTFLSFDKMLLNPSEFNKFDIKNEDESNTRNKTAGTTAIVCLLTNENIYAANIGDSRAILSRKGVAVDLSQDHKHSLQNNDSQLQKQFRNFELNEG